VGVLVVAERQWRPHRKADQRKACRHDVLHRHVLHLPFFLFPCQRGAAATRGSPGLKSMILH
jgi:hypothetical protein